MDNEEMEEGWLWEGDDGMEEWYWEDDMPTPIRKAWWIDLTATE